MEPLKRLDAGVIPLPITDCDTDQIIPSRYLSAPRTSELADVLFANHRASAKHDRAAPFILDDPRYRTHKIVTARANFGCGSSREHAVWALYEYGIRVILAPSFGEIFHDNCLKNGLLPVALPSAIIERILTDAAENPNYRVAVDLPGQTIHLPDGLVHTFTINAFAKTCLMQGMDDIAYTLSRQDEIEAYERAHADPAVPHAIARS